MSIVYVAGKDKTGNKVQGVLGPFSSVRLSPTKEDRSAYADGQEIAMKEGDSWLIHGQYTMGDLNIVDSSQHQHEGRDKMGLTPEDKARIVPDDDY